MSTVKMLVYAICENEEDPEASSDSFDAVFLSTDSEIVERYISVWEYANAKLSLCAGEEGSSLASIEFALPPATVVRWLRLSDLEKVDSSTARQFEKGKQATFALPPDYELLVPQDKLFGADEATLRIARILITNKLQNGLRLSLEEGCLTKPDRKEYQSYHGESVIFPWGEIK